MTAPAMPRPTIPRPMGANFAPFSVIARGFSGRYFCGSSTAYLAVSRPFWKAPADMDTTTPHVPLKRVEDDYLLRGAGRYMADAPLPGQTYAAFVRSPHAHAEVKSVDTQAALAIKGVVAVITMADI